MRLDIMAIKDVKMGKMCQPFFTQNVEVAKRMVKSTISIDKENNNLYKYPEDFQLFKLGTFNEEEGTIESKVEFITNITELKGE